MIFPFVFFTFLCGILIFSSLMISKSNITYSEKKNSILSIIILFTLVSVLNEVKKSNINLKNKENFEENYSFILEKKFYSLNKNFFQPKFPQLPILMDFNEFIKKNLNEINKDYSFFYLIGGETKIGITFSFLHYVKFMQSNSSPTLYLDCIKKKLSSIEDFLNELKISEIKYLEEIVIDFNKKKKIPMIIFDHVSKKFLNEENSLMFNFLKNLYLKYKVKIILIADNMETINYYRNKKRVIYYTYFITI